MARARALIFPGEEDFGLVPLEAMAVGCPVIAYGAGGALDTVAEGRTGLFFHQPTPAALVEALRKREGLSFDREHLRQHAQRFGVERFRRELAQALEESGRRATSR
ncbi:MAG: glycosyltransferase family 4 protein, partial [Chloroflexi bacterium]|nr:glycosyltransferase family 4 protein [Chloroflexota bacterium]